MRRLPIYFLIDTKLELGSEKLIAVNNGLQLMINNFKQNPQLIENAIVSINSLSENNFQINPLIELVNLNTFQLISTQSCFLGKNISLLGEFLQKQDLLKDKNQKKDWKPIVIIFLNNYPDDDFEKYCNHYKKLKQKTIVVVLDKSLELLNLKNLSEHIIDFNNITSNEISKYFFWSDDIFPFSEKIDTKFNKINLKKNEKITHIFPN
jgi:uncharacterized protein YegL